MPTLGARPLQKIKAVEIDALYKALAERLSPRTVHHVHVVLGTCLRAAERKDELRYNPIKKVDPPAAGDSDAGRALEQEELAALLDGFRGSPLYPIVASAAFTGARRNELLALRWSDVDLVAQSIRIERALEETKAHGVRFKKPKTRRGTRTIGIDGELAAILKVERDKYLRLVAGAPDGVLFDVSLVKLPEDALVFPAPDAVVRDGNLAAPRDGRSVTKEFRRRATKLGFKDLRFHDLRGTHETALLERGVAIHVVAARCGHDPGVLLRVYARRTRKADTSAAAVIGELAKAVLRR